MIPFLAAGVGPFGPLELAIILVVVLLIFGASRLGDIGGALGKSIREFRREANAPPDREAPTESAQTPDAPATAGIHCAKCGAEIENRDVKFCPSCGSAVQAAV